MDIYGMSSGQDYFGVDELLDFSNDDNQLFSSTTTATADSDLLHHNNLPSSDYTSSVAGQFYSINNYNNDTNFHSTDFTDHLCVPNEDVAELEWLSNFVDDSFSDFPANNLAGTINFRTDSSFHGRSRSKRTRAPSTTTGWTGKPVSTTPIVEKSNTVDITKKRESYSPENTSELVARRCTHCASDKTPQWRTGPLGPKTLCNACGVRYKSGRLVPEYRPAASPTFVLTQHSNSHRKVMELRRQKEMLSQQQPPEHQFYGGGHHRNFEVC